ncbi:hypothetical protein CW705_08290 [Candidatus Bathyarchaeota archaeon]|nr:MAG: hypothetical protein CW705_08290 [Candidatus Bathyarchaeota archaeon]
MINVHIAVIDVCDGAICGVKVLRNPAATYKHGAGPIVVKMLADAGVTAAAARELGLGAGTLLEQNNIKKFKVKSGITVKEAIENLLKEL